MDRHWVPIKIVGRFGGVVGRAIPINRNLTACQASELNGNPNWSKRPGLDVLGQSLRRIEECFALQLHGRKLWRKWRQRARRIGTEWTTLDPVAARAHHGLTAVLL